MGGWTDGAGMHMHSSLRTQKPLRPLRFQTPSAAASSSLSQWCGTDGGGKSGTGLRGRRPDRFVDHFGFTVTDHFIWECCKVYFAQSNRSN